MYTHHEVEDHVADLVPDLGRDVQAELDEGGKELLDLVDQPLAAHQLRAARGAPRLCAANIHVHCQNFRYAPSKFPICTVKIYVMYTVKIPDMYTVHCVQSTFLIKTV